MVRCWRHWHWHCHGGGSLRRLWDLENLVVVKHGVVRQKNDLCRLRTKIYGHPKSFIKSIHT